MHLSVQPFTSVNIVVFTTKHIANPPSGQITEPFVCSRGDGIGKFAFSRDKLQNLRSFAINREIDNSLRRIAKFHVFVSKNFDFLEFHY